MSNIWFSNLVPEIQFSNMTLPITSIIFPRNGSLSPRPSVLSVDPPAPPTAVAWERPSLVGVSWSICEICEILYNAEIKCPIMSHHVPSCPIMSHHVPSCPIQPTTRCFPLLCLGTKALLTLSSLPANFANFWRRRPLCTIGFRARLERWVVGSCQATSGSLNFYHIEHLYSFIFCS